MSKLIHTEAGPIIVDPATEMAIKANAEKEAKKAHEQRIKSDLAKLEIWKKDLTRVKEYNSMYKPVTGDNIIGEVFVTYPKEKGSIMSTSESMTGLSLLQESQLRMYAYVKDLHTGDIHTISDDYIFRFPNPAHEKWIEKAKESPTFKAEVPEPPSLITGLEMELLKHRFMLHKIDWKFTPQEFYTFQFTKYMLKPELKLTNKK